MRFFTLILSLILVSGCTAPAKETAIEINGHSIKTELAITDSQHYQGLSDRATLPADSGMLFLFAKPGPYKFVMRKMKFPLDIIWLSDNKIIYIAKNLPPEGVTTTVNYGPDEPADKVLEVNAGLADKYGWQIGQTVSLK